MNLQDILTETDGESARRQSKTSLKSLKAQIRDLPPTLGFADRIAECAFSVIAEIKTKSPSMGTMNPQARKTAEIAHLVYQEHPLVSAISVLTQESQFGGSIARLKKVRQQTRKPILRKDFIASEYEVYYSRAVGADAILLMANVVTDRVHFEELHSLAMSLGLDVLCEIHSEDELDVLPIAAVKMCGINSRKFKSSRRFFFSSIARHFNKDVTTDLSAFRLFESLQRTMPAAQKIAESGMTSGNLGRILATYPFNAALIGTSLLRGGPADIKPELDSLQDAFQKSRNRARAEPVHSGAYAEPALHA